MISIIVPAHDEASVIERCLCALIEGAGDGELEVIVVANGCRDRTADIARGIGGPVRVIETGTASKTDALNLGERASTGFPRIYVDADVVITLASVRALSAVLAEGRVLAAAPAVETVFPPGAAWMVRAYYAFWMALPYIQEGLMAAGVYAVSRQGRRRWDAFPDVISDDGFVRLHFTPDERVEVGAAVSRVTAPGTLGDLVRIKTRSRLGALQLRARFPDLYRREAGTRGYLKALATILMRPGLYPCAISYLWVNLASLVRAKRRLRALDAYLWERDESSR
jgi:glycosyltransferase involved in cell wall biosynthesis